MGLFHDEMSLNKVWSDVSLSDKVGIFCHSLYFHPWQSFQLCTPSLSDHPCDSCGASGFGSVGISVVVPTNARPIVGQFSQLYY